jgi:hypothetical protein
MRPAVPHDVFRLIQIKMKGKERLDILSIKMGGSDKEKNLDRRR